MAFFPRRRRMAPRRRPGMARRRFGARTVIGRRYLSRRPAMLNPTPTFTETVQDPQAPAILGNAGGNFSVAISAIPQLAQYSNLYRQYRINWVKVMVFPDLAGDGVDVNTLYQNNAAGVASAGKARIAFAINDTPGLPPPINEADVLTDNGCKVKTLGSKWSCSFKPVVDQQMVSGGAPSVGIREKYQPWLNFAAAGQVDPQHYGVSYWISHYVGNPAQTTYKVYYKINFTLRDAK